MSKAKKLLISQIFYTLAPLLLLGFLAGPVQDAVRASDAAAWWILLAALGAVGLNWYVYYLLHRKRPSLLVFAHGVLCLLIVSVIQYLALPGYHPLSSALTFIGTALVTVFLLLLSTWLAARTSRPTHAAAVAMRIALAVIFLCMVYQIYVDFRNSQLTGDTWITIAFAAALLLALHRRLIVSAWRRSASRRRSTGLVDGKIVRIVGETHLDLDGDYVTLFDVIIRFTVNEIPYETRARASRGKLRRYGKEKLIGRTVPVHYNPSDPTEAYADRIDRHILDQAEEDEENLPAEPEGENA